MSQAITIESKQLNNLVRKTVISVIQEMLADPDYDLELRPEFIQRLEKSMQSKEAGRLTSFEDVKSKHQI